MIDSQTAASAATGEQAATGTSQESNAPRSAAGAGDSFARHVGEAVAELQTLTRQLRAQEVSIPEALEKTMKACQIALSAALLSFGAISTQKARVDAIAAHIKDSGRLHEAVSSRLDVLAKT